MSSFCSSNFHFDFSLVFYSNICNRLSETNATEHRVQTSLIVKAAVSFRVHFLVKVSNIHFLVEKCILFKKKDVYYFSLAF